MQRFHRGAFKLAVELNQEILPIVFCDTNTAMPRDAYWFEPYRVTVRALPRITPENFDCSRGVLALMRHCENVVREALQQQLDAVDVLHYWRPEKQQAILEKARRALRPGGRLILRDGMRAENAAHERVTFWERIATRIGHNRTREGLHFLTLEELEEALRCAGFANWELMREAGRDSNLLLVATV